jgi:alpha-L-fucosidase
LFFPFSEAARGNARLSMPYMRKAGYKDFISRFKAEHFDPVAWDELFKKAGAKYVVPVAEHRDGFAM